LDYFLALRPVACCLSFTDVVAVTLLCHACAVLCCAALCRASVHSLVSLSSALRIASITPLPSYYACPTEAPAVARSRASGWSAGGDTHRHRHTTDTDTDTERLAEGSRCLVREAIRREEAAVARVHMRENRCCNGTAGGGDSASLPSTPVKSSRNLTFDDQGDAGGAVSSSNNDDIIVLSAKRLFSVEV
jgi:hypothetical protein